ncbi:hypothetical protein [Streptomyces sp. NPDC000410]|uniref:hypothetical protein n=1 Tax=Streptomyces sp. NPDC000410 TaxID=3154254 RepID=UPI0033191297
MHKLVRTGAVAAAGLAAALALTGCGGDAADKEKGASAPPSAAPGGAGSGSGADSSGEAPDIEGTWSGLSKDGVVALSVSDGRAALIAGQSICDGTVTAAKPQTLSLKCDNGNTDRTQGTVESSDGKRLVISWSGGAKDTLARTEPGDGGTLPGLPTGLPSQYPTDLVPQS